MFRLKDQLCPINLPCLVAEVYEMKLLNLPPVGGGIAVVSFRVFF